MTRQRAALARAQADLAGRDPVLDRLVATHGPCRLPAPSPVGDRFGSLAESIAYQQLHGAAAARIWQRVEDACGGAVTPSSLQGLGPGALRGAGLSGAKVRCLLDLADHAARGDLPLARIGRLDDEAVIASLTRVWGIGRWTAQMFLMFTLGRLDVWPVGDHGVRTGYALAWGGPRPPAEAAVEAHGARFAGGRSLVAWYCWRAADTRGARSG